MASWNNQRYFPRYAPELQEECRERLVTLHDKYGVSIAFVARQVGVSDTYLSMYFRGIRFLGQDNLHRLETVLSEYKF
jgi:transcriptional regulator with XRE-family HTH domain